MATTIDILSWPDTQQENARSRRAMPDPHPEWLRQAKEIWDRIDVGSMNENAADALAEEMYALHDRIAQTPAQTQEGVMVQLRIALEYVEASGEGIMDCEGHALRNAIATLASGRA